MFIKGPKYKNLIFNVTTILSLIFSTILLSQSENKKENPTVITPPGNSKHLSENEKKIIEKILEVFRNTRKKYSIRYDARQFPYLKVIKGSNNFSTIIYRCRNTECKTLVDALESIVSSKGTVEKCEQQNLIIVHDINKKINELKDIILGMDVKPPQILVEAKIVEVYVDQGMEKDLKLFYEKYDKGSDLTSKAGINLRAPNSIQTNDPWALMQGSGINLFPYKSGFKGMDMKTFNLALKWLLSSQKAKILSSPNLIVKLGSTASIVTGEDLPIQSSQVVSGAINTSITFKRIGVKLNVTPTEINEDTVHLKINPEVSQVLRYETFVQDNTQFRNPVITIRNINTELTVHDGEVIMLGGLYSSEETKSTRKPPIIGSIPLIGELFSSKNTHQDLTQLIFFLKIRILPFAKGETFYDIGESAEILQKLGELIQNSRQIFPIILKTKKKSQESETKSSANKKELDLSR